MRGSSRLAWVLALLCGACHRDAPPIRATPDDVQATTADKRFEPQPGLAHSGNIIVIKLSPNGDSAVTRDHLGGLRVWTALDGTRQPHRLPLDAAARFAIARSSKHEWIVAAIDTAGSTHVYRFDDRGADEELVSHAPSPRAIDVKVLTGGRVLILRADHSVSLHESAGIRVTRFEKRSFRPTQLMVSSDSKTLVALEFDAAKSGLVTAVARRFDVPQALTTFDDGVEMELPPHAPGSITLSPTGDAIAFAQSKNKPAPGAPFAVVKKWNSSDEHALPLDVARHAAYRIHFLDDDHLVVHTNAAPAMAWIVDIKQKAPTRVFHPIMQNISNHTAAGNTIAMGYQHWLFVQDIASEHHRFLGYDAKPSTSVAVSPSGTHVGWADRHRVWIDRIGDATGEPWQMALPTQGTWPVHVGFLDDQHIGIVTKIGVTVVNVRTKKVVAQGGPSGHTSFLTQWQASLIMISGSNSRSIYELRDGQLHRPYLLQEGGAAAWLLPATQPDDEALLLLRNKILIRLTLAELRSSMTKSEIDRRFDAAKELEENVNHSSKLTPIAIDNAGARFYTTPKNGKTELTYSTGTTDKKTMLGNSVRWVNPSPSGHMAIVSDHAGMLQGFSTETMERVWSHAPGTLAAQCNWSADSRYFGCASASGGYVIEAGTGNPVHKRCSGSFEVRTLAPKASAPVFAQRTVCEP